MTPEERFAQHEQWLRDHDRAIAEHDAWVVRIRGVLDEVADLQRRQSAVLLELTQQVTRLLDRENGRNGGTGV